MIICTILKSISFLKGNQIGEVEKYNEESETS